MKKVFELVYKKFIKKDPMLSNTRIEFIFDDNIVEFRIIRKATNLFSSYMWREVFSINHLKQTKIQVVLDRFNHAFEKVCQEATEKNMCNKAKELIENG